MNILLVNDDGFYAQGIKILMEELKDFGTIYRVAPKVEQSGKSVSANFFTEIKGEKVDEFNYIVEGSPADCVKYATKNIPVKFDLVISGCNNGLNCSFSNVWSGTMGACIHARYLGLPAVAFSTPREQFPIVKKYAKQVMQFIVDHNLISLQAIISVNFPYGESAKGIKLSEIDNDNFEFIIDHTKGIFYHKDKEGNLSFEFPNKNGDLYHLGHGYISIEPLSYSYCNKEIYDFIKAKADDVEF